MTVLLTTTDAVKRQLAIGAPGTLNTKDDDLIAVYVEQASELIQRECMRIFGTLTGEFTHDAGYPVSEGPTLFLQQDAIKVDYLINGSNGAITPDKFRLLPLNASPKYAVQLLNSSGLVWQTGQNAVTLFGTMGYCLPEDRPADITLAATRLASFLYMSRDNDGSIQVADGTAIIPADAPSFVMKVIGKYVRKTFWSEATNR